MTRLALALALLASPVAAETVQLCSVPWNDETDLLTIGREDAGAIRLEFWNRVSPSGSGVSTSCEREHTFEGLTLTYSVQVRSGVAHERYSIEPPPGYIADPPFVEIPDGDVPGVIVLRLAMF